MRLGRSLIPSSAACCNPEIVKDEAVSVVDQGAAEVEHGGLVGESLVGVFIIDAFVRLLKSFDV